MENKNCIFCKIIAQEIKSDIVYQTDSYIVINDLYPKAPVHLLIIPKTHLETMASITDDDGLGDAFFEVVRHLAQEKNVGSFNLISNNGVAAGQSVMHLHWHFLAGKNLYQSGFSL